MAVQSAAGGARHLHFATVKKWGRSSSLTRYALSVEGMKRNLLKES